MGLTMAEVMVLVLFALLLLVGLQTSVAEEGERAIRVLEGLRKIGIDPSSIPDNFTELVPAVTGPVGVLTPEAITQAVDRISLGRQVIDGLGQNSMGIPPSKAARDAIAAASKAYQSQTGAGSAEIWITAVTTAFGNGDGNGLVFPPCVKHPDGRPAYVLTTTLGSSHITVTDREVELARGLDVYPLFATIKRAVPLAPDEFLAQTSGVFEWSRQRECRFFVWIEDATAQGAKQIYKQRLRTVEQHFYKFEPQESIEGRSGAR
jgi:hypothetical protein